MTLREREREREKERFIIRGNSSKRFLPCLVCLSNSFRRQPIRMEDLYRRTERHSLVSCCEYNWRPTLALALLSMGSNLAIVVVVLLNSEGGIFQLSMKFPPDYPMNPPELKFLSDFWHPNGSFELHQDYHPFVHIHTHRNLTFLPIHIMYSHILFILLVSTFF